MLARAARRDPPFNTKPVLQHLQHVIVESDYDKLTFSAADFLPLFNLPPIQIFSAHALHEALVYDYSAYPKPDPGTSTIRELRLGGIYTRCNGDEGMANYITSCASLEILEYQHTNQAIHNDTYTSFHPGAFYPALVTQKHSLRELRLNDLGENTTEDYHDEDEENEHFNRFGSLAEFCQLRELRIPVRILLKFGLGDSPRVSLSNVLPPSLEYLHLSHYQDEDFDVVMANLGRLVSQRIKRFPNLTKLRIKPAEKSWKFEPLTEICRKAGIDFDL